jgi:uncharacterized protein (DUF362 family)
MSASAARLLPGFARRPARVAIRRAKSYGGNLLALVFETLREFDLPVRGKTVLLKPNFVAFDPVGVRNTHPAVVAAVRESFLRLGAREVVVGDGPAVERDTQAILDSMRLRDHMGPAAEEFVDLNLDDVHPVKLKTRASRLRELYLPAAVLQADFVVSLAKLKTHHWTGVTLTLKNMFGIVPGSCYGWPKNLLHWAGITRALLDLASTVPPDFSIVDGIVGMEGNGPLEGTPRASGVLVLGDDPVAVDATSTRIMGLVPERIDYLKKASRLLGHIREERIQQLGEKIAQVRMPFQVLENFRHLLAPGNGTGLEVNVQ